MAGKLQKRDCVKYFDYDKMKCKPCLRTRDTGDYFIMDKEGRRKSLGRYFIDTKNSCFGQRRAASAGRWFPYYVDNRRTHQRVLQGKQRDKAGA